MTRLLRAEWRKVVTTNLWWGMLIGTAGLTALAVVGLIASNGLPNNPSPPLTSALSQRTLFAASSAGEFFSLVVGIIIVTTEFRHMTSRPTFLVEPRRERVIAAKMAVSMAVGVVYALAGVATALVIAVPWLSIRGIAIQWSEAEIIPTIIGTFISVTLFAIVGVGVGVLIRNQVAAVVSALAYRFVAESLISLIPGVKEIYPYLPGAAASALVSGSRTQGALGIHLLEQWQGGLVLFGWGILFAVLGWFVTARRDIP